MSDSTNNRHVENHTEIQGKSLSERRWDAGLIDWFYDKDSGVIESTLRSDLKPVYDSVDIDKMRLVTINEYLPAFMRELIHVYDSSPVIKWSGATDEEGGRVDEPESLTRLRKLLMEVDWTGALRDNLIQCRLHNTVFASANYNKDLDRMFIETGYNIGNSWVQEWEGFFREWEIFAYEVLREGKGITWIVWDRKRNEHYEYHTDKTLPIYDPEVGLIGDKIPIGDNENIDAPNYGGDQSPPYVFYRYSRSNADFWGHGMISLIDLIRSVNMMLSMAVDDTLLQTMHLLVMNFTPTGTEGEKGQLKLGMRHPIIAANTTPGTAEDPKAEVVSGELFTDEIIKIIDKLLDFVANMFEVDNPIRDDLEKTLSGVALRIRAEPMQRNWAEDITRVMKGDRDLVRSLVEVNNLNRKENQIDVKILDEITIDYIEPSIVKDEDGEFELERKRQAEGYSNKIDWVMQTNPEFTEADAREFLERNREINALFRAGTSGLLQGIRDAEPTTP